MTIEFVLTKRLPAGHLFSNLTHEYVYDVVSKHAGSLCIVDDVCNKVWVSKPAFKQYFKEVV